MATTAQSAPTTRAKTYEYNIPFVIGASAAGTTIEWYDFYLYGVLATLFATQFYPPGNEVAASSRAGSRPPRRSACCWHSWSSA